MTDRDPVVGPREEILLLVQAQANVERDLIERSARVMRAREELEAAEAGQREAFTARASIRVELFEKARELHGVPLQDYDG